MIWQQGAGLLLAGLFCLKLFAMEVATLAGGCFWCLEPPYDKLPGVARTVVGYAGGPEANPTYEQVTQGSTQHVEAIQVTFDPQKISYQQILEVFWRNIDPTDDGGQFCDRGPQYRSVIFYHDAKQQATAVAYKENLLKSGQFPAIVTEIRAFTTFYPAEGYHQDYYQKNPLRYKFYRYSCGRDQKLETLWQKKSD